MNIIVILKQVPDLIEELQINPAGTALDRDALSFVLNEFDDHALEEALLLKESVGGSVTAIGVDTTGELDNTLYTALAKGADKALKIVGDFEDGLTSHALARLLGDALEDLHYDLILTGVQAADDLDGQIAPMLAVHLGLPHVGVVTGVQASGGAARVNKEYWGGMVAEMEVALPAVLGIQAARQPPRYVLVSRVRQAMKEARIEEIEADLPPAMPVAPVRRMFKPEVSGRAEFIPGDAKAAAKRMVEILRDKGIM